MKKIYALFFFFIVIYWKGFSQNVGIGTAGPASKLEIKGGGTTSSTSSLNVTNSGAASLLFVRDDGNVGIGNTSPAQKLDVNGRIRLVNSQTEIYQSGNRLVIRGEDIDNVAQFASYGLFLPRTGQSYNLYLAKSLQLGYSESDPVISYRNGALLFSADATERMRLTSVGNLGIGKTPSYKLDVNAANATTIGINTNGYAQDMSGRLARNLISSFSWNIGAGSVGIFAANQTTSSENEREWGDGPHGQRALLWKCIPSGDGNGDGGWNTSTFEIDHAKTYRVSVWIKKTGDNDGTTYLGILDNSVVRTDGTPQGNPYFWCGDLPVLNRWYLVVGYVYGSGDATNVSKGGIYDGVTGQKVVSFAGTGNCNSDYKFTISSTIQQQRAYLYYNGNTTNRQYFWNPRFEEVNGSEPTIQALLGNTSSVIGVNGTTNYVSKFTSSSTIGNSQIFDDGANVAVGHSSPARKLDVDGVIRARYGIEINSGDVTADNNYGIYFHGSGDRAYAIYRESGGWSNPYPDLRIGFHTGIKLGANASYNGIRFYTDHDMSSLVMAVNDVATSGASNVYMSGNLGVGMTPSQKLDVSGNVRASGIVYWGNGEVRTETRADAGLQGNAGARSGFYETSAPSPASSWPTGASSWWHLLDVRHSNNANNYALQIAGSFFDQDLYYRKTNGSASTAWTKILSSSGSLGQSVASYTSASELQLSSNNTGSFSYGAGVGWTPGTWQSVSSMSVTKTITSGNMVHVTVNARVEGDNYNYYVPSCAYFRLMRGSTEIARTAVYLTSASYVPSSFWYYNSNTLSFDFVDTGVSGSQTYSVEYWLPNEFSNTEAVFIGERALNVIELRQ
jgi:hypothetical protein